MNEDRIIACRSDSELFELAGITVVGGKFSGELRASVVGDDASKRGELIASVRSGTHTELLVNATTFRQKDGIANRKYMRLADDELDAIAASFVGMPVLLDHDSRSQEARIGTIVASKLSRHGGTGWAALEQTLRIVKPNAVISVLDGTIDRFSIGWIPTGPVLCSVHGGDVRGPEGCYCWPGDEVLVDGKKRTVEFVATKADGIEVSAVNVPAVKGTKIDDIRTALAAELSLDISRRVPEPARTMRFALLAAALGLTAINDNDEAAAVRAVDDLRRAKLNAEQERATALAEKATLATEKTALEARIAVAEKTLLDVEIDNATKLGKLKSSRDDAGKLVPSKREERLRRIGEKEGLKAMRDEIGELDVIVPVDQRAVGSKDPTPREATFATEANDDLDPGLVAQLTANAERDGQDVKVLIAEAKRIRNRNRNGRG